VILSCMDSRGPPEILFDQPVGNLFVMRVAGNIINNDILAGMQYATEYIGSKVIVVMGHTHCGAVTAACSYKNYHGYMRSLLEKIVPAVRTVLAKDKKNNCKDPRVIDQISRQNVLDQMADILKQSSVVRNLVAQHKVLLVGAMHNIKTGKVTFFDKSGQAIGIPATQ